MKTLRLNGKTIDPKGKTSQVQEYKFIYDFSNEFEIKSNVVFKMPDNTEKGIIQMWFTKK